MLNRPELLKELIAASDLLFDFPLVNRDYIKRLWNACCADQTFMYKARLESAGKLTEWIDSLELKTISEAKPYTIRAFDGSQIYPDRHQGISCFLINIGSVFFDYHNNSQKPVAFHSQPYLFTGQDFSDYSSTEFVNAKRQELEFAKAVECAQQQLVDLILFDGSLIFWNLENDIVLKELFFPLYIKPLEALKTEQQLFATYISYPRSKDIVKLLQYYAQTPPEFRHGDIPFDLFSDNHVLSYILEPNMRTNIFIGSSKISNFYSPELKPCFFYLHVGYEIARVEIPYWIASNQQAVDSIAAIVIDQVNKARGYPICLAEAHEQAVIKGPDRDFFYHILQKLIMERKQRFFISQKLLKKRGIGI